jgi:hypothetical protein
VCDILITHTTSRLTFIHDLPPKIAPIFNTGKANFIGFSVHTVCAAGFAEGFEL